MILSDEKLSAFLDAELPESEMEAIRQQISEDEALANRLAELALVDAQIAQHYAAIDARPLPDAVANLLAANSSAPAPVSATIIQFPLLKKIQRGLQQHAAVAACTALVMGFGFAQLLPETPNSPQAEWNTIAAALNTATSGTEHKLANDMLIKPRLTFVNAEGNFCRQFHLSASNFNTETIACRIANKWQPEISVYTQGTMREGDYQTANNNASVLDQALDNMMRGDAFDAQAESDIIQRGWKND